MALRPPRLIHLIVNNGFNGFILWIRGVLDVYLRQVGASDGFHHSFFVLDDRLNDCNTSVLLVFLFKQPDFYVCFLLLTGVDGTSGPNNSSHQLPILKVDSLGFLLLEYVVFRRT